MENLFADTQVHEHSLTRVPALRTCFLALFLFSMHVAAGQTGAPLSVKDKKAVGYYTEADNFRVRGQYPQAIALLEKALEREPKFFEALFRMGLVYKSQKEFDKSNDYFLRGVALAPDARWRKAFAYELGENYMQAGNYAHAAKHLEVFLSGEIPTKPKAAYARLLLDQARYALANMADTSRLHVQPMPDSLNLFALQYFPVLTADEQQIFFTRRLSADNSADEDLVTATRKPDGTWTAPVWLSPHINTPDNEGTCTISADGRTLIFTSCGGRKGFGNCDLFQSVKTGENWSAPVNLGPAINTAAWESQPSLSADGRVLYFVSDRKGGLGGRDLYVAYRGEDGNWTKAQNLGKNINTPYDEISPFIHASNRVLFFSAKGRPGFGGYDVYRAERVEDGWGAPVNAGYPINNHQDQFSLFITPDGARGYYAQEERQNVSRLCQFEVPEALQIKIRSNVVKGFIRDRDTGRPLKATVELHDLRKNEIQAVVQSDSVTGSYLIVLNQGAEYALHASAPGYLFSSAHFNYQENWQPRPVEKDIFLDRPVAGRSVTLNNVFFAFNSFALEEKSMAELDRVAAFLKQNPDVAVEIGGHTDNVGSDAYNQNLSLQRARSVAAYLESKGILGSRLSPRGYGSKRPVKPNDTEENRQANRRIEFRVVGL
jgi:outer membrane protein OmpA-like peptidoglycan-associated protein/tetratricopeptide (TPR) repeat protein